MNFTTPEKTSACGSSRTPRRIDARRMESSSPSSLSPVPCAHSSSRSSQSHQPKTSATRTINVGPLLSSLPFDLNMKGEIDHTFYRFGDTDSRSNNNSNTRADAHLEILNSALSLLSKSNTGSGSLQRASKSKKSSPYVSPGSRGGS